MSIRRFLPSFFAAFLLLAASPAAQAACSNTEDGNPGADGDIEFFSDGVLKYCDDTNWIPMTDASIYYAQAIDISDKYVSVTTGLTGVSDSKMVTGSLWVRPTTQGVSRNIYTNEKFSLILDTNDNLRIKGGNAGGTILDLRSSDGYNSGGWLHIMFSFDLSDPAKRHIYINDVSDIASVVNYTDDTLDLNRSNHSIGAYTAGANDLDGYIADFWMDFGTYIDLSIESNRRKFIDADGMPVDLGADGSTPTGSAPEIFLSGDVDTWETNDGTGGGFTENGTLTTVGYVDPTVTYPNITSDLIGHWKLDETSGTTATDSGSGGNNGTVVGTDFDTDAIAGRAEGALDFDGSDDEVETSVNDLMDSATEATLCAWIKPEAASITRDHYIMSDFETTEEGWGLIIDDTAAISGNTDTFTFFVEALGGSGGRVEGTTDIVDLDTWTHVCGTFSGGNYLRLYKNGIMVAENTTSIVASMATNTATPFKIADKVYGGTHNFEGSIDEVQIYTRALSDSAIAELYRNTGLVGYWKLDEKSGTTATDSSGNGNTGAMLGGLDASSDSINGKIGAALNFDGTNTIQIPDSVSLSPTKGMSAGLWFRAKDTAFRRLLSKWRTDNSFQIYTNSSLWAQVATTDGPAAANIGPSSLYDDGGWHHVFFTYDGANIKGYFDGTLLKTVAHTGDLLDSTEDISIGSEDNIGRFFDGDIDDVRIYNGVLSSEEINDLYKAGITPGLVGHWKLDETTGTTAYDSSGNGNDGTLVGAGTFTFDEDSTTGKIDTSLNFESLCCLGQRVEVTSGTNFPSGAAPSFTVALWAKPIGDPSNGYIFFLGGDETADNFVFARVVNTEFMIFYKYGSSIGDYVRPDKWYDGQWRHLAYVQDGTNTYWYENGTLRKTFAGKVADIVPDKFLINDDGNGGLSFDGLIDDVRLYNHDLSASEIAVLATCTGPGAYYYNATDDVMQWCSGVNEAVNMGPPASGAGGCTSPVAGEGALIYDTDRYKFCDGNGWVDIGK